VTASVPVCLSAWLRGCWSTGMGTSREAGASARARRRTTWGSLVRLLSLSGASHRFQPARRRVALPGRRLHLPQYGRALRAAHGEASVGRLESAGFCPLEQGRQPTQRKRNATARRGEAKRASVRNLVICACALCRQCPVRLDGWMEVRRVGGMAAAAAAAAALAGCWVNSC